MPINGYMKAVTVLYGGSLAKEAFIPLQGAGSGGKNAFETALERAKSFPYAEKTVLLGLEGAVYPGAAWNPGADFQIIRKNQWTRKQVLEAISQIQAGYDIAYFAWADCPFLDPVLCGAITDRHVKYAAEYSYADGFPYGFAPELLSPGTAGVLFKIDKDGDIPPERDMLFQVIQKDINAFDIETEISPVDLRLHRLSLAADSARNLLLINRWLDASDLEGLSVNAENAAGIIEKKPEILRTLPSFYNIQVTESCPQSCSYCPWPKIRDSSSHKHEGTGFMDSQKFGRLLDKIVDFSSDAVISLSLWGELALHPEKIELIRMVMERPSLSLVIETSGIGWKTDELLALAEILKNSPKRTGTLLASPLVWIVSLDSLDPARYKEIRGPGFAEASECTKQLFELFPGNAWVQAVRFKGAEDDIETFYRHWKDAVPGQSHVIIQKYDDFCGKLPKLQASDLSPVRRRPCWHLMRDVTIAVDGTVLRCREDLGLWNGDKRPYNVFANSLAEIFESGGELYLEHAKCNYPGECADCDEYYTFNF